MGRVFVNGNSGNHELRLVAVTGVATVASVVWTPTGGVHNQIKYAALTAPVTLSATTDSYPASQEVSGGAMVSIYDCSDDDECGECVVCGV